MNKFWLVLLDLMQLAVLISKCVLLFYMVRLVILIYSK